jgi:hypothetical protein
VPAFPYYPSWLYIVPLSLAERAHQKGRWTYRNRAAAPARAQVLFPDSNFARNSSCAPFQYHENRATLTFSWLVLQEQNMRFSIWRGLRLKKLPILGIGSLGSTAVPLLRNFWLTRRLLLTCCVPPVMRFSAEWWIPRFLKSHHYFFSKGQKFTHRRWWQTVQLNRLNRGDGWGFTRSGQSSS